MALERCNCEHIRHFPVAIPDWDGTASVRDGHRYLNAYANPATWHTLIGSVCDACEVTCYATQPFDREAWARAKGWTLAQLDEFEMTYGVTAESLETARLHKDAEFQTLAPHERMPEWHMS